MKQQWKKIAYILVILSLLVSCVQGVRRIQAENQYKDLQVAVRYTDVLNISQQKDIPIQEVLQALKDKGATTIFVRENTLLPNYLGDLANWKAQGKLTLYEGYAIVEQYSHIDNIRQLIKPQLNYMLVDDQKLRQDIITQLQVKKLGGKEIQLDGQTYIEYRGTASTMSTVGVGFPLEDLQLAAGMGYVVSPQAKAWATPSEESIQNFIADIERIPNLGVVFFADDEATGFGSEQMSEFAKKHSVGFIEFFSQKQRGVYALAKKGSESGTNYKVVRLHTVTDGEANKLKPNAILSRYWLAATERNQQLFLFKMPNTLNIDEDMNTLENLIEQFVQQASDRGFAVSGTVKNYNLPQGNFIMALLSGIAPIVVFVLLLDLLGQKKAGFVLAMFGLVGYAGILKLRPTLALQLMALFGACVFPSYALLYALEQRTKSLTGAVLLFLQTCALSFGGAITIVGLLSRTNFGLTIDLFAGVKLAHLIPLVIVLAGCIYKKYGFSLDFIKSVFFNKVTYLALTIMALIGATLLIYTTRTGNVGTISTAELAFRSALDRILGVRPRTKEFLIGYPILITLFYYGYKERYLPVLIFAIIGQISLVNTYAHIHTPLLISLIRSGYGIVFGLINGVILIYLISIILKVAKKWNLISE